MTTLTGNQIPKARLIILLYGIEEEGIGMKKRGRSCLAIAKKEFGWKGNRATIQALLEAVIDEMPDTP